MEFIGLTPTLARAAHIVPGHEYLVEHGQDYGITDDKWCFAVRDTVHVAVLRVASRALNGRLLDTPEKINRWLNEQHNRYAFRHTKPYALTASVGFCTHYANDPEQVRKGEAPTRCSYQVRGEHYEFDMSALEAEPIVTRLDDIFMAGPPDWWTAAHPIVLSHLFDSALGVWTPLREWFEKTKRVALERALGMPSRCEACHGTGLVPKKGASE